MVISRQELFAFISENQCRLTILFVNTHEDTKSDIRLRAFNITTVVTYLLPSFIHLLWHPTFKLRNALFYFFHFFLAFLSLCLIFLPFPASRFFPFYFLHFSVFLFSSLSFLLIFYVLSASFILCLSCFLLILVVYLFLYTSFLFLSFLSILIFCSPFFLCLSRSTFLFDSSFLKLYFLVPSSHFLSLSQLFLYPFVLSLVSLFMSLYSFLEATLVWRELAHNSRCCK